jgi:pimeloyl-[acyl-carrier protein] methyl ester esterase
MTLFTQTSGSGPDLVLVHGWGLHGGIWDGLAPLLEADYRITRVDLPGHGNSAWSGEQELDDFVTAVLEAVPARAGWVGWSLGGMIALRAALLAPVRVSALAMIASTPCFVRRPGWQSAMLPSLLDTFDSELEQDYVRTLGRFLALQVRGSGRATEVLKGLRRSMLARAQPQLPALRAGLAILRDTDLRPAVSALSVPALLLAGERDTLVPLQGVRDALQLMPGARCEVIESTGHAPFVAAPARVARELKHFIQGLPSAAIPG